MRLWAMLLHQPIKTWTTNLTRPFPKLVHALLSQEEQLFQGLHFCMDLALLERLTESLPDLGEVEDTS